MKNNYLKLAFGNHFLLFVLLACSGGSGGPPLNTTCLDINYNGLRFDLASNNIVFEQNTTGNLNTTVFTVLANVANPFNQVGHVKGTYDKVNDRYFFLGEWDNNNRYVLINNVKTPSPVASTNSLAGATNSISGSSEFTGAVFTNGRLYVAEIDVTANTFWISEIDPSNGTNVGTVFSDALTNFSPTIVDSFGIRYYADTDRNGKIYFLGKDKLLEIDTANGNAQQYFNLPSAFAYIDVEVDMDGFLLSFQIDNSGQTNLVSWDLASPPSISETVLVPNIPFQSESLSLVYKDCDQILHLLNHQFTNTSATNSTTILEYELINNTLVTSRTFTGDFIFGYSHLEL